MAMLFAPSGASFVEISPDSLSHHDHDRGDRLPPLSSITGTFDGLQQDIFAAARMGEAEIEAWGQRLFEANRLTYEVTLRETISEAGGDPEQVEIGPMVEEIIREEAQKSAETIVATFNVDLARAIVEIERELEVAEIEPTVDEYKTRLVGRTKVGVILGAAWYAVRMAWKKSMVAITETGQALNEALNLFFRRNDLTGLEAELVPFTAACQFCQDGVDGNPWPTMQELIDAGPWPAHPNCVHYARLIVRLADALAGVEIWSGEDWE